LWQGPDPQANPFLSLNPQTRGTPVKYLFLFLLFSPLTVSAQKPDITNLKLLPSVSNLPHFRDVILTNYNATPYIQTAQELQNFGREKAEKILISLTATSNFKNDQAYILCRMLYSKPTSSEFREPWIGHINCMGGTSEKDWPLNPIEVIDGVPFMIVAEYREFYGGMESPAQYVEYCRTNCIWNESRYTAKIKEERMIALQKFIKSPKWKRPLNADEIEWLTLQIK
jgi:hypothetical protein